MNQEYIIRNEEEKDYYQTELITKLAFWNHHNPGCSEHYLAHILRTHPDFIPTLDFVVEKDGQVIGNIMYAKNKLQASDGTIKEILSFGPLTVHPDYQREGIGKFLMEYSFQKAKELGYDTIVIFGHPSNYVSSGFKSCKKFKVHLDNNIYPTALLVKELVEGKLENNDWTYISTPAYEYSEEDAAIYDQNFPAMKKEYRKSHEEFYIYSHSVVYWD